MININTMNKLEKLGIGSDIDKLENYVALIDYSDMMGNCITTWDKKEEIVSLLKELKPNSDIFKYNWDLESEEIDEFDKLFEQYGRFKGINVNSITKKSFIELDKSIKDNGGTGDIYAFALPDGIDIRIVYRKGIYYSAYTYKYNKKGKDITEHIRNLVPYNIQEISDQGIIEVQARITMTNDALREANIKESEKLAFIVDFLINEKSYENIDKFKVLVYKIYSDDILIDLGTLWDEHEALLDTELELVQNALIRNITNEDLLDAVRELEKYFKYKVDKEYIYTDIVICLNGVDDTAIINISEKYRKTKIYKCEVQEITWIPDLHSIVPVLNITPTLIDNAIYIKEIKLNSLADLRKCNNQYINFYVDYTDRIIVCDELGNALI